jgi:hypothetical protein
LFQKGIESLTDATVECMPLDDKEQKILADIERQFYDEDPQLARAVRRIEKPTRIGVRLSILGIIVGLAVVIGYVSITWVAVLGFALLVASATALVNALRVRGWNGSVQETDDEHVE